VAARALEVGDDIGQRHLCADGADHLDLGSLNWLRHGEAKRGDRDGQPTASHDSSG
jgi:hypothetical protein